MPEAKERLARISIVRKDQADKLKMKIIQMAQSGTIREQISEERLIAMLEEGQEANKTKVTMARRKYDLDDDEDDNDDDLM